MDLWQKTAAQLLVFLAVALFTYLLFISGQTALGRYKQESTARTGKLLEELFIFHDPKLLFRINAAIGLLFILISLPLFKDPLATAGAGLIGFLLPKLVIRAMVRRRHEKFGEQLMDGLLILANGLRSGQTLVQAMELMETESTPPISQEFGLALRENRLGVPVEESLTNMSKRIPNDDLKLMAVAVSIIHSMGGNLIDVFDSLARVIRERRKLEGKVQSLTAQGRLQGIIVGLLPTGLGALMYTIDPDLMGLMFTTMAGKIALGVMLAIQVTGFVLLQKVTKIEV